MTKAAIVVSGALPTTTIQDTRTQKQQKAAAALQHVLTVLLKKNQTDDPEYFNWISANKIKSIGDLLAVCPHMIYMQTTVYDYGNLSIVDDIQTLKVFAQFWSANNNTIINSDDWMIVTPDEYYRFKTRDYHTYVPVYTNNSITTTWSERTPQQQ